MSTSNTTQTGGSWIDCTTSFNTQQITTKGTYYVYFRSVSNAEKASAVSNYQIVKLTGTEVSDYIQSGALFILDGKTGLSENIWLDQSNGTKYNGTLIGATNSDNSVYFNGSTSSYVRIAELNYQEVTMEVVFKIISETTVDGYGMIMSNEEYGGYGILYQTNGLLFDVHKGSYINNGHQPITFNQVQYSAGRADSNKVIHNTNLIQKIEYNDIPIKSTVNNTYMILGGNPSGSQSTANPFYGYIYAARMYNRVLSDDEIQKNYVIDKARFGF